MLCVEEKSGHLICKGFHCITKCSYFIERYSKYVQLYYQNLEVDLLSDFYFIFTDPDNEPFPLPFTTALFSFLYSLASYESGMLVILNVI